MAMDLGAVARTGLQRGLRRGMSVPGRAQGMRARGHPPGHAHQRARVHPAATSAPGPRPAAAPDKQEPGPRRHNLAAVPAVHMAGVRRPAATARLTEAAGEAARAHRVIGVRPAAVVVDSAAAAAVAAEAAGEEGDDEL